MGNDHPSIRPPNGLKSITKPWGLQVRLVRDGVVAIDKIIVRKDGQSSMHRHHRKDNLFVVVAGELLLSDKSGPVARLKVGSTHVFPRGWWHRFTALTDVVAYELYTSTDGKTIDDEDIERCGS